MANIYVPFDLKLKDITHGSVIIEWDLDNTVEFKPGVYYNVYRSPDNVVPYVFLHKSNIAYTSIKKESDNFFIKVTSVVPGLGESALSDAYEVTIDRGVLDSSDNTTIAITPTGRHVKLRASEYGELVVSGGTVNASISGFSTEIKQDQLIAENHADFLTISGDIAALTAAVVAFHGTNVTDLALIHSRLVLFQNEAHTDSVNILNQLTTFTNNNRTDILALTNLVSTFKTANAADLATVNANLVQIDTDLLAFKAEAHVDALDINQSVDDFKAEAHADALITHGKLDQILTANFSNLLRSETVLSNVSSGGVIFSLPWKKKSKIEQITILKEGGSATQWTIEVLNKSAPTVERNVILRDYSYNAYDPNRFDILRAVPYVNLDGADLVWIRLTPDTGISNTFYVAMSGEEAK